MKKALSLFLALAMLLVMIPMAAITTSAAPAAAWDGTSYDVSWCTTGSDVTLDEVGYQVTGYEAGTEFIIDTPAKLAGIAKLVNLCKADSFRNCTFKVTEDLDLGGKKWTIIGQTDTDFKTYKFCGSLVGAKQGGGNAVISNLKVENTQYGATGLIGLYGGKEISNLTLKNAEIHSTMQRTGSFVGQANTKVNNDTNNQISITYKNLISDAKVIVSVPEGGSSKWAIAGGICGAVYGTSTDANKFENCVFTGSVVNENKRGIGAGGICAVTEGNVTFVDCICTGRVSAATDGAGEASFKGAGGLIGVARGTGKAKISDCYVSSTVSGFQRVGGFIGDFWNAVDVTITDSQFDGVVISNGGDLRGAFVGDSEKNGAVYTNCFNSGIASCVKSSVLTFALAYFHDTSITSATFTNCYTLYTMQKTTASAEDTNKIMGSVPTAATLGANWEDRTGSYPILKNAKAYAEKAPARDVSWFDPASETAFTLDTEAKLNGLSALYASAGKENMKAYKFNVTCKKWNADLFSAAFLEKIMVNGSNTGATAQTKIKNALTAQTSKEIVDNKYDVRIIAEVTETELKNVSFHFAASYVDQDGNRVVSDVETQPVTCCYTELTATAGGISSPITPSEDGNYLIAFVISDIDALKGDMTFSVSVCASDDNGNYCIASRAVTFVINGTQVTPVPVA